MDPSERTDMAFAGLSRQAELLREKVVSSVELVELYLERIERFEPRLNAFTTVLAASAMDAARDADRRIADGDEGALLGVPVALKDNVEVAGQIATHGTAGFDRPERVDSALWSRLDGAGAILLGRTTLPELAICGFTESKSFGATRNPWNVERTTGGSSGGSGAAVAAGLVACASASDGAGSIRIPAGNCGLFGLKPQRGRVSLAPHPEHWLGLSVTGCVSRSVADTALWLDVCAGSEPIDAATAEPLPTSFAEAASSEPPKLRIAWSVEPPQLLVPGGITVDPEVVAEVERVASLLEDLGHEVTQLEPDWGLVGTDFANLYLRGIKQDFDHVPNPDRLESRTRALARMGALLPKSLIARSRRRIDSHGRRVNAIFEEVDVLLTPTAASTPVEVGRWEGKGAIRTTLGMSKVYPFTGLWNYLGNPAASIPTGTSSEGMPLPVQGIAAPHREDVLVGLAAQLERKCGWLERRPGVGS